MVVPKPEAVRDALREGAEADADALADRLERLEARGVPRSVDTDALGRAVVHGDEDRGVAFAG